MSISRTSSRIAGIIVVAALALVVAVVFRSRTESSVSPNQRRMTADEIIARGRIEPLGRVIAVSGPPDGGSTVALVDKLQVEQGSSVTAGQVVAILNGFTLSQADYKVAVANLALAKLQQAQLRAGVGKAAEIAAQMNVLEGRRAQLIRNKKDWDRMVALARSQTVSDQSLDAQRATLDQTTNDVAQAENALKALTEVRPVDDALSAGQIVVAEANLAKAEAVLSRLQIRAPISGTVLSIQARDGEAIGADGILRMGDLDHLIVVAEVDQSQIGRVKLDMAATIEGDIIPNPIKASVTRIAKEVYRQKRPSSDILVGRDAKIIEVELTPESPLPAVVGGEVVVRLFTPSAGGR